MRRLGVAMPERRCLRDRAPWPRADIVAVLPDADPPDKRAMYDELGVNPPHVPPRREGPASALALVYLWFVSEMGLVP